MQRLVFCAAAIAALSLGTAVRAAVTVIGGGQAEACSKAARAGTFVNRGIMKMRRGEMVPAVADFDQAIRFEPRLGEIYVNRGAALIGQHRYADGLSDLNKGIGLGVEEPAKAYYNRALAYEGMDDVKSAYFDYQKAVELSPDWDAPKQQLTRFHVARRE